MNNWPKTTTTQRMPADVGHTVGQGGLEIHGPGNTGRRSEDSFYVEPDDIWILQDIPLDKIDAVEGQDVSVSAAEWNELHSGERDYTSIEQGIREGRLDPLIVIPTDQGTYAVEDGWHRATIAKDLGLSEFPAYVLDVSQRQKVALQKSARTTMYHVAPRSKMNQILTEGLKPQDEENRNYKGSPEGVYLWGDYKSAEEWANMHLDEHEQDGGKQNIYEVDVTGLPLKQDSVWFNETENQPYGESPTGASARAAWYYPGDISPDRIKHQEPHDWGYSAESPWWRVSTSQPPEGLTFEGDPEDDEPEFIALLNGKQVGWIQIGHNGYHNVIAQIEVDPKYRRMGIATALKQYAENQMGRVEHDWEAELGEASADGKAWREAISNVKKSWKRISVPVHEEFYDYPNTWYHVTTPDAARDILNEGFLAPEDVQSRGRRRTWEGEYDRLRSRDGHIYFFNPSFVYGDTSINRFKRIIADEHRDEQGRQIWTPDELVVLQVDVNRIPKENINTDEDHVDSPFGAWDEFIPYLENIGGFSEEITLDIAGREGALEYLATENQDGFNKAWSAFEKDFPILTKIIEAHDHVEHPNTSYGELTGGEWANEVSQWIDHPDAATEFAGGGTIAVKAPIPPSLISMVDPGGLRQDKAASVDNPWQLNIKTAWQKVPTELQFKVGDRVIHRIFTHPNAQKTLGWPKVIEKRGTITEVKYEGIKEELRDIWLSDELQQDEGQSTGGESQEAPQEAPQIPISEEVVYHKRDVWHDLNDTLPDSAKQVIYHIKWDDGHESWSGPDHLYPDFHKSSWQRVSMGLMGELPRELEIVEHPVGVHPHGGKVEKPTRLFNAMIDGRQIGRLYVDQEPHGEWYVLDIEVAPEYRRMGVATALKQQAESLMGHPIHHAGEGEMSDQGKVWSQSTSSWKFAMPYENNVWYHVTHKDNLRSIRDHGLVPTNRNLQDKNFPEYSIVTNGVYLSQTASRAYSITSEGSGFNRELGWQPYDVILLRITGLDQSRLHPDPEELAIDAETIADALAAGDDPEDLHPGMVELTKRIDWDNETSAGNETWRAYLSLPRELQDKIKQDVLSSMSFVYTGTIPAQNIHIMRSPEWQEDQLQDTYEQHTEYGLDDPYDAMANLYRYNPMFGKVREASVKMSKPKISGPIPFIYDIQGDIVHAGHPGQRHSDIMGKFAPGGVVRGFYMPNGEVQIRAETDMPYTLYHMTRLWYYLYPELEIKSVTMLRDGERVKLANTSIAAKTRTLALTNSAVRTVFDTLSPYGKVYVVGGAIRDVVLGKTPNDIDLVVTGIEPDTLEDLLAHVGRVEHTGKDFGVYRFKVDDEEVEIALPRTEKSTGDGHKDFEITADPDLSIEDDLARRDFSVNSMAVDLADSVLIDPYDGVQDVIEKEFRVINERAFEEDPLRILRALTMYSKHGVTPDDLTKQRMQQASKVLENLSADRVGVELNKMLSGDQPHVAIGLALELGLLQHWLPEIQRMKGFDQENKYHNLHLDEHTLTVLKNMVEETDDVEMRWAALLHDVGKPDSQWYDEDGFAHYYYDAETDQGAQHEEVGSELARDIMERLRMPKKTVERVSELVGGHMFADFNTPKGARKFLRNHGDNAEALLSMRWSDDKGKATGRPEKVHIMRQLVQDEKDKENAFQLKDLAVNGNDLIEIGYPRGEMLGATLDMLLEEVISDPTKNRKDYLIEMAKNALEIN